MITSALPQPMSHERADARILAVSVGSPVHPPAPRLSSRDLLGQAREVEIEHEGMLYRLRITALGKLILTK
ncbi:MAG: hemin uptake protein HemP [Pseudomonadota bacterium]|jgi:hemin uptake protein HemP